MTSLLVLLVSVMILIGVVSLTVFTTVVRAIGVPPRRPMAVTGHGHR